MAMPICLVLFRHDAAIPFSFAFASAGSNIAARMAMMAITTSSSIKVKARGAGPTASGSLVLAVMRIVSLRQRAIAITVLVADETSARAVTILRYRRFRQSHEVATKRPLS